MAEVLSTQAILISNPQAEHGDLVDLIKRRIEGYITATKYVMVVYNISGELLEKAVQITPGKRSPTVTTLDDGKSKAVSSLVPKKEINDKMDHLEQEAARVDALPRGHRDRSPSPPPGMFTVDLVVCRFLCVLCSCLASQNFFSFVISFHTQCTARMVSAKTLAPFDGGNDTRPNARTYSNAS